LLVRPGFYPGRLALDKPLEIIGDGDSGDIVVQASGSNVIISTANMVIVRNLTIRQVGGGDWYAIDISQGRLVLEQCDISSQSLACVAVHNAADPVVRRNRIHDGKSVGIHVHDNGRGTFEDNDLRGNQGGSWNIADGCTVRRARNQEDPVS
jgi:parallel beta-helix repeat protein